MSAHRYIWEVFNGPIQEGMVVCHKCDISLCVNPAHLFLGSPKENSQDMISKGRRVFGHRKLLDEQVLKIRELIKLGHNQKYIANKFGVSQQTVSDIVAGVSWRSFK